MLAGKARFRVGGEIHELGVGDTVAVPPGVPHVGWNPTDEEVRLRIEFRPALRWLEFVQELFALAAQDAADYDIRLAGLMSRYGREIAT